MDTINHNRVYPITEENDTNIPEVEESKSKAMEILKKQLKENILLIATVLAVAIGIGLGFILRAYTNFKPPVKAYFGFPGDIFLRMLKFLILPLISSSLISGIAGLGTARAGKIAARALIYYFATTVLAVVLGLVLVSTIQPGNRTKIDTSATSFNPLGNEKIQTVDTILDLIRNLFPDNIVQMTFAQYRTKLTEVYIEKNVTNETTGKKNFMKKREIIIIFMKF